MGASYSALIKKGNRFYKNELYIEALKYYQQGKEKNRKATEPIFNTGAAYYKMEDYIKSIVSFSDSLQYGDRDEKESDIYYNLGNSYFQLGNYGKAAKSYMKGLEIDPYNLNMKYNLELTLRKLQEKEQKEKEDEHNKRGNDKEDGDAEKIEQSANKSDREELSAGGASTGQDFTHEEAERLIKSLNTDQTRIIGDIIKQRINKVQNEKDW
jgi:tetratricopeptide (TPR) repeat protein